MLVCGVDEAGRGPLAGRVYAAAVILDNNKAIIGLDDSKKLTEKKRNELFDQITTNALCYAISFIEPSQIDRINILSATLLAMKNAVEGLSVVPDLVLVDGNKLPQLSIKAEAIVKGDSKIPEISAASILAKVSRDREMYFWDKQYPEYGFAKHKGYGTVLHVNAIKEHGVLPIHRRSFAPIKTMVELDLFSQDD